MNLSLSKHAALAAALAAASLAGCSKKEAPPAPEQHATAPAPAKAGEPLKAAFIYVGPVGDAGWTFAHDKGRKEAEAKLGGKVVTTFVEKVPEGPDAERVLRDLVAQGNKLIFATSFGFMDAINKVAKDNPEVKFEHATGYKTADNLRVYEAKFYEGAYLAGILAGQMTKSNVLGFVGSFPIPEVLRNINAFTLGAQSVNPKIKTKVVWVSAWFDPPKETEAAQSLFNQGADVLLQNTDSSAVLQAAERNGKYAFGWDSDMSAVAPKAHLGSCALDWSGYYTKSFNDVLGGTWKTEVTKWGVKEGAVDLVKVATFTPAEAQKKVDEARQGLKSGTLAVFTGPIVDNTGKEVLAKGVVADDAWKGAVNFYVKGVEGKVPAGK
ncbi:MAG TPA: BMP family ABC transporter substrate-binding protein [Anaeromyxobacteraceae bacterium]|jgi:simple sugar transport system substrate-binding protein|nr:BMP family ABC transporter substrate-binding protein [Anaeromyxobacteraceae bacterium]